MEAAGIRDVLGKSIGSANHINIARAAIECLQSLRTAREVAKIRGKKPEEIAPPWQLAGLTGTEPASETVNEQQ